MIAINLQIRLSNCTTGRVTQNRLYCFPDTLLLPQVPQEVSSGDMPVSENMATSDVSVQQVVRDEKENNNSEGVSNDMESRRKKTEESDEGEYMEEEWEPNPKKIKVDESYSKKLLYIELAKLASVIEEEKKGLVKEEVQGQKELQELIEGEKLARKEVLKNHSEVFLRLEEKQKTEMEKMIQSLIQSQKIEKEKVKESQKKDLDDREKDFKNKRTNIATRSLPLREKLEAREKNFQDVESRLFTILQNERVMCDQIKRRNVKQEEN